MVMYSCCIEPYVDMTYFLVLKRNKKKRFKFNTEKM